MYIVVQPCLVANNILLMRDETTLFSFLRLLLLENSKMADIHSKQTRIINQLERHEW